jgi:DNA-directed RNA polymerase subunit RPC12/RpoP
MWEEMKEKIGRFMAGRYGNDKLNQFMMAVFLGCAVLNLFVRNAYASTVLNSWECLLILLVYIRMFSRNISKRYAENQKYLALENRLRRFFGQKRYLMQQRKEYHIYKCPGCKQKIRIPRGKGKISIRCPKCGEEFIKNS